MEIFKFKITPIQERFYNEDSSFGVYDFTTTDEIPKYEYVEDIFDQNVTIKKVSSLVGRMQQLYLGSEYLVNAKLKYSEKYKSFQYEPISVVSVVPKGKEDSFKFLSSLTSNKIANNLLDVYPNIIIDVIDGKINTINYKKVKGVGKKSWQKLKQAIIENYVISDIIILLQPLGVTFTMINKLIKEYENPSLLKKQLDDNPYVLTKIKGLGFNKVDNIALRLKPELINSRFRLQSYIIYYLSELAYNDGDTYVYIEDLKNNISNNVNECLPLLEDVLNHSTSFVVKDNMISLKYIKETEDRILKFMKDKVKYKINKFHITNDIIQESINEVENEQGFNYTKEQLNEISSIVNEDVVFVTGKAGTGKTSIMRAIIRIYKKSGYSVSSCALAAKAAKRIIEATDTKATTIHSLLVWNGSENFQYNRNNPLETDILFLDEASMVNAELFLDLLLATKESTRLIVCGDHKQLPPIGYANIFSDLIKYDDIFSVHTLTKVLRQSEMSGIIKDANLIRENINPIKLIEPKIIHGELTDMYYVFRDNRELLRNIAIKTFLKSIDKDGVDNVQIIVPRKTGCINSTQEINKIIQDILIPNNKNIMSNGIYDFKEGTKVRQTKNNRNLNIYNGDIGYIEKIYTKRNEENKVIQYCDVAYKDIINDDKRIVTYTKNEINELDISYAMTTHSTQGSGYKTVIGIIDNTHYRLLDCCMLYTMISRAKKRFLLLAEPQSFYMCIKTNKNERKTWLSYYKNKEKTLYNFERI